MKANFGRCSVLVKRFLITAALPYANAKLHIGHLRSTYIPADIYARYLRMRGYQTLYVCATDEHGTPIVVTAEKEGVTPKEIADRYHASILKDLNMVGCSIDVFSRTTNPSHHVMTQEFFTRLKEKGYIYRASHEQLFCLKCQRFLPDRYVEGACSYCGAEMTRGDACDNCGRYLKPNELEKPYCIICETTPEVRKTRNWFFKLSAFQEFLAKWLGGERKLPSNVRHYALQWLAEGLKDWCITRDLDWGVPVPLEDTEGKVVYVWFDAPIGYISSTKDWAKIYKKPEAWQDYWIKECKIVHFIGKDIIYHHAIFWLAMLKAFGNINLPHTIIAGEYLTLNKKKMSKSRGWVVEVEEYLKSFDPDSLRYYLITIAPLYKDSDFSWEEFVRKNNNELADILGNFIHRSLVFTYKYFNGYIPKPSELDEGDENVLKQIKEAHKNITILIEKFDFHMALRAIIELSALGNRYLNQKEPWKALKINPEEASTTLYVTNQIVKAITILLEPFLPYTAQKIWENLNLPDTVHKQAWEEAIREIPAGHEIIKPKPLFKKLEFKEKMM